MILKEKTLKKIKINVDGLTKGSGKKVFVKCSNCNKERTREYRYCNKLNLCIKCNGIRSATKMGNTYGKSQKKQGICRSCKTAIPTSIKWCKDKVCQINKSKYFIKIRTGDKNPAWTGNHVCKCGKKKSHGANKCRNCSFINGMRSGKNNGRYILKNRKEYLLNVKIAKKMRGMLGNLKRNLGIKKDTNTEKTLGYTFDEFRKRLESTFTDELNWNNIGKKWHIDHIVPVNWFVKKGILDPKKINKLDNLRALDITANLRKSNKITLEAKKLITKWNL